VRTAVSYEQLNILLWSCSFSLSAALSLIAADHSSIVAISTFEKLQILLWYHYYWFTLYIVLSFVLHCGISPCACGVTVLMSTHLIWWPVIFVLPTIQTMKCVRISARGPTVSLSATLWIPLSLLTCVLVYLLTASCLSLCMSVTVWAVIVCYARCCYVHFVSASLSDSLTASIVCEVRLLVRCLFSLVPAVSSVWTCCTPVIIGAFRLLALDMGYDSVS